MSSDLRKSAEDDLELQKKVQLKKYQEEKRKKYWRQEEALSCEERRARYQCGKDYITLNKVPTWEKYCSKFLKTLSLPVVEPPPGYSLELARKVAVYRGNIVAMEIDAIQNAANRSLLGGGGIDGAIHSAAGDDLVRECRLLNGCPTGGTKITRGYDLPAKYVLHTVGPVGEDPVALKNCYVTTLDLCKQHGIRSVGLCCVSTGIFGYPLVNASHIALKTVQKWLMTDNNKDAIDRIIFVCYLEKELGCYLQLMPSYFPLTVAQPPPTPAQPIEEVHFVWPWGGYRVQIAGSFNGWKPVDMNYANHVHSITIPLSPGEHQYKFIVDGEWKYNGDKPICRDPDGNVNNFILL